MEHVTGENPIRLRGRGPRQGDGVLLNIRDPENRIFLRDCGGERKYKTNSEPSNSAAQIPWLLLDFPFSSCESIHSMRFFPQSLPPSGVLKLRGWLPGPLPRPLKVMTMRLYSEKGVSPGNTPWLRSPGNASVCFSPCFFLESARLRIRHQFTWKERECKMIGRVKETERGEGSKRLEREPQTCGRGFVSLRWLAGTPPPHIVNSGHPEAIVDVPVEFGHGRVVVPSSFQLPGSHWLSSYSMINSVDRQKDNQRAPSLPCQRTAYLTTSCAGGILKPLLWACLKKRGNKCSIDSKPEDVERAASLPLVLPDITIYCSYVSSPNTMSSAEAASRSTGVLATQELKVVDEGLVVLREARQLGRGFKRNSRSLIKRHDACRGTVCSFTLRSTALCWSNGEHTYHVIVGGGELKTLQCIIAPFPSTAVYSSPSLGEALARMKEFVDRPSSPGPRCFMGICQHQQQLFSSDTSVSGLLMTHCKV
ncbi:hypothetical protein F7725_016524 [Dissostichus mawsoni]|uniref:Uncharacterized protein n=1 Tax=Dissostichus mawsoni TaxID=36200 RepID=A0A7J5Z3T6_DISMA|nr:hypothetical protein F7725_016524 [Dissostichus mawsoni]